MLVSYGPTEPTGQEQQKQQIHRQKQKPTRVFRNAIKKAYVYIYILEIKKEEKYQSPIHIHAHIDEKRS